MIEIRKSQPEDLGEIMEIYKYARSFMAAHGNPNQWGRTNWPPESVIKNDIEQGDSYVCVLDGTIVGTFFYKEGKDVEPTYARIDDGEWLDDSPYGVIHRIASNGKAKGILHEVLAWARKSCHHIRRGIVIKDRSCVRDFALDQFFKGSTGDHTYVAPAQLFKFRVFRNGTLIRCRADRGGEQADHYCQRGQARRYCLYTEYLLENHELETSVRNVDPLNGNSLWYQVP